MVVILLLSAQLCPADLAFVTSSPVPRPGSEASSGATSTRAAHNLLGCSWLSRQAEPKLGSDMGDSESGGILGVVSLSPKDEAGAPLRLESGEHEMREKQWAALVGCG